ncbi:MAG: signal peptidase I [Firmicutes bacterium]|jgi:signal peptidase I|nr:signal peptidase I [Bacillota bacterium]
MEYLNALVVAVVLAAFVMTFVARSFLVQGPSMEPTLHDGERLLVNKFVYRFSSPKRGNIVVFRYPYNPSRMFIKRVIGLPGEVVQVAGGIVYVNGQSLEEPYIYERPYREFGPAVVPEGRVFVLGDNRNMSQDSTDETVGMVPLGNIEGKAFFVYWPPSRIRVCGDPVYHVDEAEVPESGLAAVPGVP